MDALAQYEPPPPKRRLRLRCSHPAQAMLSWSPERRQWLLVHRITSETVELDSRPGIQWDIHEDEDTGLAVVTKTCETDGGEVLGQVDEGLGESFWCADLFSSNLYFDQDGSAFVQLGADGPPTPLDIATAFREEYIIGIYVGVARRLVSCKVVGYSLPDMGCKIWLKLEDLFEASGFDHCMRRRDNKWMHDGLPKWIRWLEEKVRMPLSMRRSQAIGAAGEKCPIMERRFLSFVSITLPALLALLTRFACLPRGAGGLREERAACGALEVLLGLVDKVGLPKKVVIAFGDSVRWTPPLPIEGFVAVEVQFLDNG